MPPRSTHVQPGDVSHALIQQGEKDNAVVVLEQRGSPVGLRQAPRKEEEEFGYVVRSFVLAFATVGIGEFGSWF